MNLPEQYSGNGMEFWRLTLECVDRARGRTAPSSAAINIAPSAQ